jgi:amino acid transporter
MSTPHKLSLLTAIFININVMLGTGIFINTVLLPERVGALGGLLYIASGILMLPLIICIARLTRTHPGGTFYTFGSELHPLWGFISAWSYFVGKLASAALGIHVFNMFMQDVIPVLATYPTMALDAIMVIFFVGLNLLNVRTGSQIQYVFFFTKLTPIALVVMYGLHHVQLIHISAPHIIWSGLAVGLPLTLFCCLGFEATCSLSKHIEDSKKNAYRAIIISFLSVIAISAAYQTIFYAALGKTLTGQPDYTEAFPIFFNLVTPHLSSIIIPFVSIAIAISALGGAYGILYSNIWNLFALAQHNHISGSSYFTRLNSNQIPYLCVLAEGAICMFHLLFSWGAQIPLQYTSTLACLLAYSISVASLLKTERSFLSGVGLVTSIGLLGVSIRGFMATSLDPLYRLGALILIGIIMFFMNRSPKLQGHKSNQA